jgi:hypothetical protein
MYQQINFTDPDVCRDLGVRLGRLLLYSIKARKLNPDYRELLREFDESMPVRRMLEGVLDSLGAEILDRHPSLGIVVGIKSADSPLLDHIARDMIDADERRVAAVVLATMLALYYPADTLEDPTLAPRPLIPMEVCEKIEQIIGTMRTRAHETGDDDGLAVWELVSRRMALEQTSTGRHKKYTVAWQIDRMFARLRDGGNVIEMKLEEGGIGYRPTQQLHVMVDKRLNHDLYREVSEALSKRAAAAPPAAGDS